MIVQPGFLDHWKTLKLSSVLSDPLAPIYLIRLWGYAQTGKRDTIQDDAERLKGVCRWPGDASVLRSALIDCQWVEQVEDGLRLHGWAELNARLIHNWKVGPTGGRPRVEKEPTNNPRDNPRDNPTKPKGYPIRRDRIGLDEIGLEETNIIPPQPPKGGEARPARRVSDSFKTWTREQFTENVKAANSDNLLTASEVEDFIGYWTEPTATGRFKLATEATWDTRRRMQTAVRVVFSKQRTGAPGIPANRFNRVAPIEFPDDHLAPTDEELDREIEIRKKNGTWKP